MTQTTPQENLSATKLLLDVLRNHEDLAVRNAASDGQHALTDHDHEQLQQSVSDISEALTSWELHPALNKQLKLASQELAQHQATLEQEAAPLAPEESYSPMSSGPTM